MLQQNKRYKIKISSGSTVLTYDCEVLEIDNSFVKIKDKYDHVLNLCIYAIISHEELLE